MTKPATTHAQDTNADVPSSEAAVVVTDQALVEATPTHSMFGTLPPSKPEPVLPAHFQRQFDAIVFYQRPGSKNEELGLMTRGGYWVPKKYFEATWRAACLRIEAWPWNVWLTAEFICGSSFWKPSSSTEAHSWGRCIRYFSDQRMLPIELVNGDDKNGSRKYVRKAQ